MHSRGWKAAACKGCSARVHMRTVAFFAGMRLGRTRTVHTPAEVGSAEEERPLSGALQHDRGAVWYAVWGRVAWGGPVWYGAGWHGMMRQGMRRVGGLDGWEGARVAVEWGWWLRGRVCVGVGGSWQGEGRAKAGHAQQVGRGAVSREDCVTCQSAAAASVLNLRWLGGGRPAARDAHDDSCLGHHRVPDGIERDRVGSDEVCDGMGWDGIECDAAGQGRMGCNEAGREGLSRMG